MNRNIKKLIDESRKPIMDPQLKMYAFDEEEMNEFVRLIVKSCTDITEEELGRSDLDWGMLFREHFGIKNGKKRSKASD